MNLNVKSILFFLLIFLLQAVLQGYIDVSPMIQFCLLPMVIAALPYNWKSPVTMVVAFGIGLAADAISGGIPGINAAACVLVAGLRDWIYRKAVSTDNRSAASAPTIHNLDKLQYIKFISILSAAYCILFVFMDSFSLAPFWGNLLRMLTTFAVSTLLIIIFSHFAPRD